MKFPGSVGPLGRLARTVVVGALTVAVLAAFLLFDSFPSRDWEGKQVVIPKGTSVAEMTSILSRQKALPYPLAFRGLVLLTGTGRRLRYGEYTFPHPPSAYAVWRKLVTGDVIKYPVVVRPGANLYDVAAVLGAYSLADPQAFLKAATSRATLEQLEIPGSSAEGYLVPDTYNLVKALSPEEILEIMVRPFRKRFTAEMEKKATEEGLSVHEVLTVASIIEKETRIPEEKPLISEVIHRRLALGMPLQMDPTVIYQARRFDGTITLKDLQTPGPYNTYLNRGLPPGPIDNPGAGSIAAALEPANTDYLYFVSNNDGSHTFSRTLAEHNHAVEQLRRVLRRKENAVPAAGAPATPQPPPSGPS
jgi:peptidoglycan lytic transglycosylase G